MDKLLDSRKREFQFLKLKVKKSSVLTSQETLKVLKKEKELKKKREEEEKAQHHAFCQKKKEEAEKTQHQAARVKMQTLTKITSQKHKSKLCGVSVLAKLYSCFLYSKCQYTT